MMRRLRRAAQSRAPPVVRSAVASRSTTGPRQPTTDRLFPVHFLLDVVTPPFQHLATRAFEPGQLRRRLVELADAGQRSGQCIPDLVPGRVEFERARECGNRVGGMIGIEAQLADGGM